MANSYVVYPGTGAQTQFVVTFPFLSRTHVDVLVDGVSVSFTWINDGLIQCAVAPALDSVVRIERSSSPTTALVDFTAGYLSESDLDTAYLHSFYLAQEAVDTAAASITLDATNNWDAQGNRIVNVADGQAAQDAATKAQLDAVVAAAGNVPTPGNPADNNKLLKANAGTFGWGPDISTFGEDLIDSADAAAARTTLDAQEDVMTTNGDLVTRAAGATARIAIGSTAQVLKVVSGAPAWADDNASSVQSGTTHSPGAADNGKTFIYTHASGCAVTVPAASGLPAGWMINVVNASGAAVIFTRSGSDTIWSKNTSLTTLSLPQAGNGGALYCDNGNAKFYWVGRRSFEGTGLALNAATTTQAHGLGVVPTEFCLVMKNTTAELGYSIGDEVPHPGVTLDQVGAGRHHQIVVDATNLVLLQGTTVTQVVLNKTTPAAGVTATAGSWSWLMRAVVIN